MKLSKCIVFPDNIYCNWLITMNARQRNARKAQIWGTQNDSNYDENCTSRDLQFGTQKISNHFRPMDFCSNEGTGLNRSSACQQYTPKFQDNRHMNVVYLSTLSTGRFYIYAIFLVRFLLEAKWTAGQQCGRKGCVKENLWLNREKKPRSSGL